METTDKERRLWSRMLESTTSVQARLIRDADRLAEIERQVRKVIEALQAAAMTEYYRGDAVKQAEYNALADKMRSIIDW